MNFFPHIPMLSTVFNSIGCYLLPFGVVLLWLLYESKKVKTILLAALVLLSMVCMFFHEAFAPSREYPWDCMVEHIFTGTLLPFLCLLGYLLYVFLCACIPVYRKVWKGIGFFVLGGMSLAFEYVNVSFPVMLLAGSNRLSEVSWFMLPMTNVTAMVSPKARPKPSMMPPMTPFLV